MVFPRHDIWLEVLMMRQDVWAEVVATAETLKRNKLRRRSIVFRGWGGKRKKETETEKMWSGLEEIDRNGLNLRGSLNHNKGFDILSAMGIWWRVGCSVVAPLDLHLPFYLLFNKIHYIGVSIEGEQMEETPGRSCWLLRQEWYRWRWKDYSD